MKRICWTEATTGGVSVFTFAQEFMDLFADEQQAIKAGWAKVVPKDALHPKLLNEDDGPLNRRFRRCWRRDGDSVPSVDLPLARQQRMDEIRAERNRRLQESDHEYLKEIDIGDA